MAFEKIKAKVRSRLKDIREESELISARNKEIKRKALESALNEKEIQEIRLAQERQRIKADRKLKQMKQGGSGFFSGYNQNYGSPFGQPRQLGTRTIVKYKGKGKKRRKIVTKKPIHSSYSFGGLAFGNSNRVDVLGLGR